MVITFACQQQKCRVQNTYIKELPYPNRRPDSQWVNLFFLFYCCENTNDWKHHMVFCRYLFVQCRYSILRNENGRFYFLSIKLHAWSSCVINIRIYWIRCHSFALLLSSGSLKCFNFADSHWTLLALLRQ